MAKNKEKAATEAPAKTGTVVTVADLAKKYKLEGRKVRMAIRELGLRAPELPQDGTFGPRSKYEWTPGDKDLAKIEAKLAEMTADGGGEKKAKTEKADKTEKKSKKKAEEPAEEEESEDEDDSDDEDEEDDE